MQDRAEGDRLRAIVCSTSPHPRVLVPMFHVKQATIDLDNRSRQSISAIDASRETILWAQRPHRQSRSVLKAGPGKRESGAVVGVELHVADTQVRGFKGIGTGSLTDFDVHGDVLFLQGALEGGIEVAAEGLARAKEFHAA